MNKKAFTLIELLIVIAIIGILAVAFGPSLFDGPAKARDAQRIEDLRRIANFINLEYVVPGKSLPDWGCITPISPLGVVINANLADFSGKFPQDPDPQNNIGDKCFGTYAYTNYSTFPGYIYDFVVYAKVEDASNGNYDQSTYPDVLKGNASLADSGIFYMMLSSSE